MNEDKGLRKEFVEELETLANSPPKIPQEIVQSENWEQVSNNTYTLKSSPKDERVSEKLLDIFELSRQSNTTTHLPSDQLPGEDYVIRTGERQQDIFKKLGVPITKYQHPLPLEKPFEETWEYPFCIIYFKKGRVRDLVFKRVEGSAYYEGAPIIDVPAQEN